MSNNSQLHFLQQKIAQLQQAIFYNDSIAAIKLPTSLVQCVGVDEIGYVWFWMNKPVHAITAFENSFPVRLDFYKKGNDYFLQVKGNAQIVTNPDEVYDLPHIRNVMGIQARDKVLVKVKMAQADYHDTQRTNKWWLNISQTFKTWFKPSGSYLQPQYVTLP